jgi:hypothetical protein
LQLNGPRHNGRKSDGPRSAAGKSRASRNALRHGLAALINRPHVSKGDIEHLALAICGHDDDPQLFQAALAIAENHLLRRVIKAQQIAVVERLRDRTAIALAEGDNSFDLGRAKFLSIWLLERQIEACIPQLLKKYHDEQLSSDHFTDYIVPISLKALLEEGVSKEEYDRVRKIAEQCLTQEERSDDDALEQAIPDLKRLDRYQCRAWSQHKRAVSAFINIKLMRKLEKVACIEPHQQIVHLSE